jgi:hypothetical protein
MFLVLIFPHFPAQLHILELIRIDSEAEYEEKNRTIRECDHLTNEKCSKSLISPIQ